MNINWNKDDKENARIAISDGEVTHYVSEEQLIPVGEDSFQMQKVARAFTHGYDHNGEEDTFAECWIEDLQDGQVINFKFDGHGNFQWNV